jgi:hypothetical protein
MHVIKQTLNNNKKKFQKNNKIKKSKKLNPTRQPSDLDVVGRFSTNRSPKLTCCLNADSLGGIRTREQSLLVASLTRSLFKLVWQDLYFAFGSYDFVTTFLATH